TKQVLFSIEKQSEHPLAEAVINHLENTKPVSLSEFESITGKGVKAVYHDERYFVGNQKLLLENNISIADELQQQANQWSHQSKTVIWFSDSKKALSVIAISDIIKATSVEAI